MKKRRGSGRTAAAFLTGLFLLLTLCACGAEPARDSEAASAPAAAETSAPVQTDPEEAEKEEETSMLRLMIGETAVAVDWEANASVEALEELCRDEALTISLSMYGGFEQVGSIGRSLPRSDVQTATESGDIVLYAGNQIVLFYGSNAWAYTRLGRITDRSADDMTALLGQGDVTITLWLEENR